jgi:hypothetical protein
MYRMSSSDLLHEDHSPFAVKILIKLIGAVRGKISMSVYLTLPQLRLGDYVVRTALINMAR